MTHQFLSPHMGTQFPDNTTISAKANSALCGTSPTARVVRDVRRYREDGQ